MKGLVLLSVLFAAQLSSIDTLLQTRPDSALTLLLDGPMDEPYYQLLLSEALYKNDYQQANREDLLDAVAYFDSIGDPFLAARAHYINGVGYYEMDCVVPACAEYLKALEIMETHFKEKELVGHKAKFMALTYTHLEGLFSDQYLHEQAVYFGKQALKHYQKYDAEPWHVAWVLEKIAMQYDMMDNDDTARFYYLTGLQVLPDTNNLTHRDISSQLVMLSCKRGESIDIALQQLNTLLFLSESKEERLSRQAIIGEIFFLNGNYDSDRKSVV